MTSSSNDGREPDDEERPDDDEERPDDDEPAQPDVLPTFRNVKRMRGRGDRIGNSGP